MGKVDGVGPVWGRPQADGFVGCLSFVLFFFFFFFFFFFHHSESIAFLRSFCEKS